MTDRLAEERQVNMNIGAVNNTANNHASAKAAAGGAANKDNAVNGKGSSDYKKAIGLFTSGSKAYPVTYADSSTPEDPVVKIGKTEIHVKNVDPKKATAAEMCALMSYQDDTGISGNKGMSSFSKLKAYGMQAEANGVCSGLNDAEAVWTKQQNWTNILESAGNTFSRNPATYGQASECGRLIEAMMKFADGAGFIGRSADPEEAYNAWMSQKNGRTDFDFGSSYDVSGMKDPGTPDAPIDPVQFIHDRIEEMFIKLQNGDIEPKFMIGSSALTQKEWDKLLEEFDSQEEALRKIMEEDAAKKAAEDAKFEAANATTETEAAQQAAATEAQIDMLLSETVALSRFSTGQVDDDGQEIEDIYTTAMDSEGIRCGKPGRTDYLWEKKFSDEDEYERAKSFLEWAGGYMDNFRFAAHESFWNDLLDGSMDEGAFRDFLANSTKDGKPIYTYGDEENMYIDREKIQWAKYMNRPGSFVVIEDIQKHLEDKVIEGQKKLAILPNPLAENNMSSAGNRNLSDQEVFCRYPGSELYSASELARMIYEETWRRFMF